MRGAPGRQEEEQEGHERSCSGDKGRDEEDTKTQD